jgi:hypothetical protein
MRPVASATPAPKALFACLILQVEVAGYGHNGQDAHNHDDGNDFQKGEAGVVEQGEVG